MLMTFPCSTGLVAFVAGFVWSEPPGRYGGCFAEVWVTNEHQGMRAARPSARVRSLGSGPRWYICGWFGRFGREHWRLASARCPHAANCHPRFNSLAVPLHQSPRGE